MFQVPSVIPNHGIKTLSDGGIRLLVDCQEINPAEAAELFSLKGKVGWFLFKEAAITEEEVGKLPDEIVEFKNEKSPSERLRNVMFVYYKQKYGKEEGFDSWRKEQMEKIIQQYKDKLDSCV